MKTKPTLENTDSELNELVRHMIGMIGHPVGMGVEPNPMIADRIIELVRKYDDRTARARWVSVKERVPSGGRTYLLGTWVKPGEWEENSFYAPADWSEAKIRKYIEHTGYTHWLGNVQPPPNTQEEGE